MKNKVILLMYLFMSLPIIVLGQYPFEKTQKVHAWLVEGRLQGDMEAAYNSRDHITYVPKNKWDDLSSSVTEGRKIIPLYEHMVEGAVRTPNGNIGIRVTKENEIPPDLRYRKPLKSNPELIVFNILNSTFGNLEDAYFELKNEPWVEDVQIGYTNYFTVHSDPFYPQQYYLKNTGQFSGTSGVDINVEKAWDITTGTSSIQVAVIDQGLEDHYDLEDAGGSSRIVDGYTPQGSGDGTPEGTQNTHGIAAAGVLSASHNNVLVKGVAPGIELLGVNIFTTTSDEIDVAAGIEWAVDNGARILSNSWGGNSETVVSPVDDAIDYALDNDVLVVFAAGNDGTVVFPGNYPGVITVNAIDNNGDFWNYNGTSSTVELVAPSGDTDGNGDMYTLDREGSNGDSSGDYVTNWGGTSGASPQVAGVIALMYSVNPSLTPAQVESILYSTAVDMGAVGKDNSYGHGRLNAYEAVKEAVPTLHNESFTSSTTLPAIIRITGTASVSSGVTLTVGSGDVTIVDGTMNSSGSTIAVNGRLIVEESADLSNIHLDVNSGGELIIRKGASLSFDSGQGIEGNGVITIKGTNADRITLEASGGSNWNGVEVNEDNSSIKYVDIEDAVNGIVSYNVSGLEVQNVEVFNSSWDGFRFINTSTSSPVGGFGYFRADGNGTYGVYYDGGTNDELRNSIMVDNPSSGLFITGGASLEGVINSRIYDGGTNGIRADNYSYLELNSCSIHDNAYREVFAYNNSTVDATGNWWGTSFPSSSQFEEVSGGSIDYSNHLFFDPLPTSFEKRVASADLNSQAIVYEDPVTSINSVASLREALSGFKKEEALTELQRISGSELSPDLNEWAKIIQVEIYQRLDNHQQAIEIGNTTLASQGVSPEIHTTMGRRLFYSYLLGTEDVQAAETMLSNLEQWGEDESELKQLTWLLERHKEDDLSGDGNESPEKIAQETDVQLSNYPNPFNPSTVIKYQLPQNTAVRLQVFDMLGREVVTLVDEQQSAGEYSATFDASMLSSGIYIYRLQAGSEVITNQMTLIK